MKVTFIIWYNEKTPQIVDVLDSILQSSGPAKISIIAIKSSTGRQLEDSAVRWTPGCRIIHSPGCSKKQAWEKGINSMFASDKEEPNFIALCDPFFIANPNMFKLLSPKNFYKFYLPYSDQYDELECKNQERLVKKNVGGSFLLLNYQCCYNFRSLPEWLSEYCIDYFIIDQLGIFGYTGHKIPGCYVKSIKKDSLTSQERKSLSMDLSNYQGWLDSKKGGYNNLIKVQNQECLYSEENCD